MGALVCGGRGKQSRKTPEEVRLAVAHERDLQSFADFELTENLSPRTMQSLAMTAEIIHGAPARYSFAPRGKDGHPFSLPLKTYDESIDVLRRSLDVSTVAELRRLPQIEQVCPRLAISPSLDGRRVTHPKKPRTAQMNHC
jgi:hypothetical protein